MVQLALLTLALLFQASSAGLTLEGQVVALGTNDPVPRARIVLAKLGGSVEDYRTTVADASGRFTFRELGAGSYRVFAERQGFLRGEHGRRAPNVAGTPVALADGQAAQITIGMIKTGVIAGRVFEGTRPARNVWVRAMRASYFDGQRTLVIADYAKTDDLGEYRLFGLAPGRYFVSAVPQDRPRIEGDSYVVPVIPTIANSNQSRIVTPGPEALASDLVDPAAIDDGIFLPVFYPGTTDATAAATIEVRPGATLPGIDLAVERSTAVRVRGQVIDGTTGRPAENVSVMLAPQEGRILDVASAVVNASGEFELVGVPPGRHEIVARTTNPRVRLFGIASVDVGNRPVDNVTVAIRPGSTLNGTASIVGADGLSTTGILVQLTGVGGMTGYSAVPLRPDGTFAVENVEPREYRVRIVRQGRFLAPAAARFGGEDVTGRPFRFASEMAGQALELVVNLAVGGLDVLVVDASRRPLSGVTVALVPDAPRRDQSSLYRTASSDIAGRLRFDDVVPGDYKLFAEDLDPAAWQDPDVIRQYEDRGSRVRVDDGARHSATLKVSQ